MLIMPTSLFFHIKIVQDLHLKEKKKKYNERVLNIHYIAFLFFKYLSLKIM